MKTTLKQRRYARIYSLGYQAAMRRFKAINEPESGDGLEKVGSGYLFVAGVVLAFVFGLAL